MSVPALLEMAKPPKSKPADVRPTRRLRQHKGWSQMRLAGVAGVAMATVTELEKGSIAKLRVGDVARVAVALGCAVLDLIPALQVRGGNGVDWSSGLIDHNARLAGLRPLARHWSDKEAAPAVQRAMEWLRLALKDGPRPVQEMKQAAQGRVAPYALAEARKRLRVTAKKAPGFGANWTWTLPESPDAGVNG